ncbi:Uncharacterized protein FKW44_018760, partial [Caligus rogercresseyi]
CFLNGLGDHFKGIGHFIKSLNDDNLAIVKAKKLFKDPKLPGQLAFIKGNFNQLVHAILSLQERLSLAESIGILEMVQMQLTVEFFASKLNSTLELKDDQLALLFSCTPITSVDCKKVFSKLKSLLSDQRTSLTEACNT